MSGELNLATVLICIVAVFLICHIPRVILNCTEFFLVDEMLNCPEGFSPPNWNLCLASLNHALLIINASINFIIYTSMGDSFNIALKQMIKRYWNLKGLINQELILFSRFRDRYGFQEILSLSSNKTEERQVTD